VLQLETAEQSWNVVAPKSEWLEQQGVSDNGRRNRNMTRQGTMNCEIEGRMKKA